MTHLNSTSTFWRDIYYESIVEHDPRLRTICTQTPWINFDRIVDVDRVAAINDDIVASHPIAIYLNKLAPKSQKFRRINKDVIYKRHKPVRVTPARLPLAIDTGTLKYKLNISDSVIRGLKTSSFLTINPRHRWLKLYERNPQIHFHDIRPIDTTEPDSFNLEVDWQRMNQLENLFQEVSRVPLDEYLNCYKVRIYHRQAWNPMMEGASFPSIWKEPDPSTLVDDVSGVALYHITLLGRDMICECNKCTTGLFSQFNQDSAMLARLDLYRAPDMSRVVPSPFVYSESFAEGCMLPSFFVCNELNKPIKKSEWYWYDACIK